MRASTALPVAEVVRTLASQLKVTIWGVVSVAVRLMGVTVVARTTPFSRIEMVAVTWQEPLSVLSRTQNLNCWRFAPVVGLDAGVGNVTRRSVPPAAVGSVAVKKFPSGVSGSSVMLASVPV